jgi:putative membrane protein
VYGVGREPDPRFTFANERTFLAWVRTALGFVAAGVALAAVGRLGGGLGLEARVAALLLVLAGLVSGVGALTRWVRNERALRLDEPLPSSPLLVVVAGIVVLAAAVAVVVVALA